MCVAQYAENKDLALAGPCSASTHGQGMERALAGAPNSMLGSILETRAARRYNQSAETRFTRDEKSKMAQCEYG